MKAIIDGKLYDTDTAEELGSWVREGVPSPRIVELYRAPGGSYFLHVFRDIAFHGHPLRSIYPLEDNEVLDVVIDYGGVDEALRLFPERIERA